MRYVLVLEVYGRDNQTIDKSVSVKRQMLDPSQRHISIFLSKAIGIAVY